MPSTMALPVNSRGDCAGGTYGWNVVFAGSTAACVLVCAMARDGSIEPCESIEQAAPGTRPGLGADDEPPVRVPPLPQRARRGRRSDRFLTGTRRTVPPQRGADSEGPRVLRRVRRARGWLLRQGTAPAPPADPRTRSPPASRHHGCRQPRPGTCRLSRLPPGRVRDRGALRRREREDRPRVTWWRADPRHERAQEARQARSPGYRRHRRSGAARAAGGRSGGDGGHQGHSELLARRVEGSLRCEAEERGPHGLTRESVVLSRPGGERWL